MKLLEWLTPRRNRLFWASYTVLLLGVAGVGALGGLLFGYTLDLPEVSRLEEARPNIVSYVYSSDGRVLGQFALERRILVSYSQIPKQVREAVLAAEDSDFFQHSGIDIRRLLVTVARDILLGERKGASTLTMQLSKLLFTSPRKTIERKIKDMLFAMEIEKDYSKEQIFSLYCNLIYMGHGNYGLAAAADYYFHKTLADLTLAESATLAGLIQRPMYRSPINHPDRAVARRNTVLNRMHQQGFIDTARLRSALAEPLVVRGKNATESPAPYFVEWVRQYLERHYSTKQIWEGGMRIYTTLDYDMQIAARRALRDGLRKFDKEHRPWKRPSLNVLAEGKDLSSYTHPQWRQVFFPGQLLHGLVMESSAGSATIRFGNFHSRIGPAEVKWTGHKRVDRVLRPGDVALFLVHSVDRSERTLKVSLDRIPQVQGALLALQNSSGAIRAMVGGFDFEYSQFNRATQALRQPGSIFKPFTYVAAMEAGYTPYDLVLDAPVSYRDALGRVYSPENSDETYKGLIPIRDALAHSRNVPTIRLANALGIEKVIEVAHRFGIRRNFPPYLPVALGAGELTLLEITSAFSVFPNKSVRALPYFVRKVEDYNGVTLEEHQNQFEQVISPETAEKMIYLLTNVVQHGTGWRARALKRPVGGKTGTTNDSTDSWFVGFTPEITAGVWAGYDEKKSLGEKVYGATLALPIWVDFMQEVYRDRPVTNFDTHYIPSPPTTNTASATDQQKKPPGKKKPVQVEDIPPN